MKSFSESWNDKEIKDWLDIKHILVLFVPHLSTKTAQVIIHAYMNEPQRGKLAEEIARNFGGVVMSPQICKKVNEFARKWYNKNILKRRARVINIGKK